MRKRKVNNSKIGNIILFSGCVLVISCLIYMILNLDVADKILSLWLPITIAGVVLIWNGFLIRLIKK